MRGITLAVVVAGAVAGCDVKDPRQAARSAREPAEAPRVEYSDSIGPSIPDGESAPARPGTMPQRWDEVATTRPAMPFEWVAGATREQAERIIGAEPQLVHAADSEGRTALHWAARLGRHGIVAVLARHGADLNAADRNGDRPLHVVMDRLKRPLGSNSTPAQVEMLREEMAAGFPVSDAPLPERYTRTASELIKGGADVNAVDRIGQTPIYRAVAGSHVAIFDVLIGGGARLDLRDIDGTTLTDIARGGAVSDDMRQRLFAAEASQRERKEEVPRTRPRSVGDRMRS